MKSFFILVLACAIFVTIIFFLNKVSLNPMNGVTADGQTVEIAPVSTTPSETVFEPLDLSSNEFSVVSKAFAGELAPTLSRTAVRTMGNLDAPVKMYVFSSLTCSHCSYFHTTVLKDIEKRYVDTGKVSLIYIDFPFDKRALAGAMLARCVKPDSYFSFLNILFKHQKDWAFKPDAQEIIMGYASLQGLTKADVRACLSDEALKQNIINLRNAYIEKYNIDSTPTTVIIKGEKTETVVGANGDKLDKVLKKMIN